jgi:hypothetical protein
MGACLSAHGGSEIQAIALGDTVRSLNNAFDFVFLRNFVYAWRLIAVTSKHSYEMRLAHDRLGTLHQRLADNEATVMNALSLIYRDRPLRDSTHPPTSCTCAVCLETKTAWVSCSCDTHKVCLECISSLCFNHKDVFGMPCCPSIDGCSGVFNDDAISQTEGGRHIIAERQHRKTLDNVIRIFNDSTPQVTGLKFVYLKSDGTYSALQCSKCGFGPIEHSHCDDLREFHKKRGILNQCPQCHHFEDCAKKLTPWSGDTTHVHPETVTAT